MTDLEKAIEQAAKEIHERREVIRESRLVEIITRHIGPVVEEQSADAARYRFLRDNKVQSHSLHMNGVMSFRFTSGWPALRAHTLDEAIDSAIEEVERQSATQAQGGE